MKYTFKIQEQATYIQAGTVDVEADSLEEARQKVLDGKYDEHWGDNEILLDSEEVTGVEIIEDITNDLDYLPDEN